jgi:hypothetical protein
MSCLIGGVFKSTTSFRADVEGLRGILAVPIFRLLRHPEGHSVVLGLQSLQFAFAYRDGPARRLVKERRSCVRLSIVGQAWYLSDPRQQIVCRTSVGYKRHSGSTR